MNRPARLTVPPVTTNEDRLPDERAVWRDPPCPPSAPSWLSVTVDYGDGLVERTTVANAAWTVAQRWRFGWGPKDA